MKFATKEDLELPIEAVFEMISDFHGFEKALLRRDAEITRKDELVEAGIGMQWNIRAVLRNKIRNIDVTLSHYDAPNQMQFRFISKNIEGTFLIELVALSRERTRLRGELELRPRTLSARLMIQSAKLARSTLNRRYRTKISHFARTLEDRYKKAQRA